MTTIPAVPPRAVDEAPAAAPVAAASRIDSLDVLRGFAVLGILVMNIQSFGLPMMAYMNPTVAGGFTGANYWIWVVGHLLADLKFMSIFSMLFGAGVILFTGRLESRGRPSIELHYRRMGWLLLIGMIHAYLLWYGDILVSYAVCGMILFWVRKASPWTLIALSIPSLLVTAAAMMLIGFGFATMQKALDEHDARVAAMAAPAVPDESAKTDEAAPPDGAEFEQPQMDPAAPPPDEAIDDAQLEDEATQTEPDPEAEELLWGMSVRDARTQLGNSRGQWSPGPEELGRQTAAMRGSYAKELIHRTPLTLTVQLFTLILYSWRIMGMMMLGMALFKWDVLSAARSAGLYLAMVIGGFGAGVPLVWMGLQRNLAADFDFIAAQFQNAHYNYLGSIFVALGWIGVIMLLCRSGVLQWLIASLGAVGRMAFTNYLMHTIICTTIFYGRSGLGLAKFNQFERTELLIIVAAIFLFQMIVSPSWLRYFRFGPFEWLWRSLTYWQLQPMRLVDARVSRGT